MRCAQLLLNTEQCLVYGTPNARLALDLHERGDISKFELDKVLMADRRYFAFHSLCGSSTSPNSNSPSKGSMYGWLYKKGGGTSTLGRRTWRQRWCKIEGKTLSIIKTGAKN